MNINLTQTEFDQFIMLYLKEQIESIDELDTKNELFVEFIANLKKKSFWPLLNRVFLDIDMIQKLNTDRVIREKEKDADRNIRILM